MKNKYYKALEKEEASINERRMELQRKRQLIERSDKFADSKTLESIVTIINAKEDKEYGLYTFSFTEKDHTETRWRSSLEGVPNVSGAELAATAKPYTVTVKGKSFSTRIIVDKESYELFQTLSFSKCSDYEQSLKSYLRGKKHAVIPASVSSETFDNNFGYIKELLECLTEWRLENGTLDIPSTTIASITNKIVGEDRSLKKISK